MRDGDAGKIDKINRFFTSHIPIPDGCVTLVLILGALATLAASALALSAAVLK